VLASLKYFCEQTPQYHVVAAGSLLGVAVNRERYSFPVGKIDELSLHPLDFEEFLWALGYGKLTGEIRHHFEDYEAMPESLHSEALELYQKYFIIGGMPAAAKTFLKQEVFSKFKMFRITYLTSMLQIWQNMPILPQALKFVPVMPQFPHNCQGKCEISI
jgi:predicted AAA+ superfamily ATPase